MNIPHDDCLGDGVTHPAGNQRITLVRRAPTPSQVLGPERLPHRVDGIDALVAQQVRHAGLVQVVAQYL